MDAKNEITTYRSAENSDREGFVATNERTFVPFVFPHSFHKRTYLDVRSVVRHATDLTPKLVVDLDLVQLYPIVLVLVHLVLVQNVLLLEDILGEHGQLKLLRFGIEPHHPDLDVVDRTKVRARMFDELVPGNLVHVEQTVDLGVDVDVGVEIRQGYDPTG